MNQNENIVFKNNQLINNGIENKNYKFNPNTIQSIIKINQINKLKVSDGKIIKEQNLKEPQNKIYFEPKNDFNQNNYVINISPKNSYNNIINPKFNTNNNNILNRNINPIMNHPKKNINNINQNININLNHYNNQINGIYKFKRPNKNINVLDDEEEIYFEKEDDNEGNYYDNINIYTYFEEPEIIKEVNEDMEESSSEIMKKVKVKVKNKKKLLKKSITDLDEKTLKKNKVLLRPKKGIKIINSSTTNNIKKNKNIFQKIKSNTINKSNKRSRTFYKKEINKKPLINSFNKGKNKTLQILKNFKMNMFNNEIEDLKKYVKLQMNKLQMIKPPNIYNFIKK